MSEGLSVGGGVVGGLDVDAASAAEMSLRTLKFGDRTISYDTGINSSHIEVEEDVVDGKTIELLFHFSRDSED